MPPRCLLDYLAELTDPRDPRGRLYPFLPLLTLCLVAILAGQTSVAAIAQFGRLRGKRLGHALGFPRGTMPCANTLTNLLAALDPDHLDRLVGRWLQERHTAGWDHLALDGKTLRGSRDGAVPGVHLLAAYAPHVAAVVAQLRVEATTNEHKAALRLLGILPPLAGTVVTADAMFTHADVATAVLAQGGDYVLYAKDNQAQLQADLAATFTAAQDGSFSPQAASRLAGRCANRHPTGERTWTPGAAYAHQQHLAQRLPDGLAPGAASLPPGAATHRGHDHDGGGALRADESEPGRRRRRTADAAEPRTLGY